MLHSWTTVSSADNLAGDPLLTTITLNDNNSLFGDGDAESWMEVYEYDLQTLQGGNVFLTGPTQ